MNLHRLTLGPQLSKTSWILIEVFFLFAILLLPFSKSAAEIGILVAIVLWLLRKFPWDEPFLSSPRMVILCYGLFFVLALLSAIQAPTELRAVSARGVFKWLKYLLVFFLSFEYFQDTKRQKRFLLAFLASLTFLCLDGFYQLWTGFDLTKHNPMVFPSRFTRISASMDSPNNLGTFLILGIPLVCNAWAQSRRWTTRYFLSGACLILLGTTLVLTLSRGAVLGLVGSVFFYVLFFHRKKLLWIASGVTMLAGMAWLLSPVLRENFMKSLHVQDITVGERIRFWQITLQMIGDKPWLGHGINTYYKVFGSYAPLSETYRGYAHNCFLQMWAEIGLLGLLALWLPFAYLRKASHSPMAGALFVGITAYLLQSFLDTNFYALQTAMIFWVLWGFYILLENKK